MAVSPNDTSKSCSNCGHGVKKSLTTRIPSCPRGVCQYQPMM
ncbi:MAG: zinc ribbon domain-containing protein [Synechococcales cyanobacterium]|nr:transposase [Cyanobacteria bacterium REEB444]